MRCKYRVGSPKAKEVEATQLTLEDMESAVSGLEKGELKPYIRSEPVPSADDVDDSDAMILVGDTIGDFIRGRKDVFSTFSRPGVATVGNCKEFGGAASQAEGERRQAGDREAGRDSERVSGVAVSGYPTGCFRRSREQRVQARRIGVGSSTTVRGRRTLSLRG